MTMSNNAAEIAAGFGMTTLSPHLTCRDADAAIAFYKEAFDAEELNVMRGPDGAIMHAALRINGGSVMLMEENLEWDLPSPLTFGNTPVRMHLMLDDAASIEAKAVKAGAIVTMPVEKQFWGDIYGVVQDPFGHKWALSTPSAIVMSNEEALAAMQAMSNADKPA